MLLDCQRDLFEIPAEVAYLNCAYMSPLLRAARAAGEAALARKARPWEIAPRDFFTGPEEARALVAELVDGDADGVAIVPSASYGLAVAAANLPLRPGQAVVTLAEQFPSNVYAWHDLARQHGAEVAVVPRPADGDWTAAVLRHLDERAAVVALPHCHWTDGGLLDLGRIGARAREVGAALVVDATQSLGALPFSVAATQPDFLVAATYKWLLGPYSLGFLYVAPRHRDGRPIEHTWLGRAGSEDFARLVDYRDDYQPGARRFDMGERANFALLPVAIAALRQLLAWGVPSIAETLRALTDEVAARAGSLGLTVSPRALRAGHIVGLRLPAGAPPDLAARLAARGVYVSMRAGALRVSPHLYNTTDDIARLFDALREEL